VHFFSKRNDIPVANLDIHIVDCKRNAVSCPICHVTMPRALLEEHHETTHAERRCPQCEATMEIAVFDSHLVSISYLLLTRLLLFDSLPYESLSFISLLLFDSCTVCKPIVQHGDVKERSMQMTVIYDLRAGAVNRDLVPGVVMS